MSQSMWNWALQKAPQPVWPCTHNEQVEEIRAGINLRRCALDQRQLLQDGVQLLGLRQVDPALLWVGPVWQGHVDSYKVLQVHTQDGETEACALREALAVAAVVTTWCDQLHQPIEQLTMKFRSDFKLHLFATDCFTTQKSGFRDKGRLFVKS